MKRLFSKTAVLAVLACAAAPATGAAQEPIPVRVEIAGVEARTGYIRAALYSDGGWEQRPVHTVTVAVGEGAPVLELQAPGEGRYAIRLFHDVDGDGELDSNLMGFPTEPYGTSNDAPPRFGPPAFDDAVFELGAGGAAQIITLQG